MFNSLDGTWDHVNDSDLWYAVSNPWDSVTNSGVRTQDGYLTISDRTWSGANRKIMLAHNISDGSNAQAAADNQIDLGVTISFRTRLNTVTGPADGAEIRSSGKGMFTINQRKWWDQSLGLYNDNTQGTRIGFSLILQSDYKKVKWTNPNYNAPAGLVMNNRAGNVPSRDVDTDDPMNPATQLNVLPLSNLTDWHEFWITIRAEAGPDYTHRVDVYVDGSLTPATFYVTESSGLNDYPSWGQGATAASAYNYIAMGNCRTGSSSSPETAAFDVDFFAWAPGVIVPVPEPATAVMGVLLSGLLLLRRRG